MKTKKLNCIRAGSRRWLPRTGGLLVLLLTAVLLITPALADSGVIPRATLANKPEVTIRGNVVVDDNGAPTGFYELALCVKSPMRIYGPDPATFGGTIGNKELTEDEYAQVLAQINETDPASIPTAAQTAGIQETDYTITYYPFSAASAVVGVNTDVLTAVNWDVAQVVYGEWDDTAGSYKDAGLDSQYPRGIDLTNILNVDPAEWGPTDPDPFPDVTKAKLSRPNSVSVALDVEGDRSGFTAAAQVDHYYENGAATAKAAILTLSAHAPDNKPVVFTEPTPVAVIRFSYDLKRFPKGTVMVNGGVGNYANRMTGTAATEGFWLGLDRENSYVGNGKTPLTWLADTHAALGTGFAFSDQKAAETEAGQVVWTKLGNAVGGDWDYTEYYYYLGANANIAADGSLTPSSNEVDPDGSVDVSTPAGIQMVEHIRIPDTKGVKILGHGQQENQVANPADYSYYSNILYLNGPGDLQLKLVNDTTFRAPRGKGLGGNQILFYDWDDTLIGALIVGDGDVREAVNTYVENNLVHPDLRAGEVLATDLGGTMPNFTTVAPGSGGKDEEYMNLISSLDRKYTYRGQYPSTPKAKGVTDGTEVTDGEEFPLTNKLDYVFYKHLNIVTPAEWENTATGKKWEEKYHTVYDLTEDPVAAQYPWAYGWAVVEDAANGVHPNKANWPVMVDYKKIADTWTTVGVGELEKMDPQAANVALPTAGAGQTMTLGAPVYPGGLDTDWSTTGSGHDNPADYTYKTSSADANGYLRFADFSDTTALFKPGQDVLIVKAVYEPGTDLYTGGNYSTVDGSLRIERYSYAASTGASVYSFRYQYSRTGTDGADNNVGVSRIREPAVQTGFTYDINGFEETTGVDLSTNVFYLKTLANSGDIIDVDLLTGGALQKIDYRLMETFGKNISSGSFRSGGGEWTGEIKDNFNYDDWNYSDRQGSDGFVIDATINTICAEGTKAARGETNALSTHMSLATLTDLNIKRDFEATPGEFNILDYTICTTYLSDLFKAIETSGLTKDSDGNDIYDAKTGYIKLGWHQIQREIINRESGKPSILSGGVLRSDSSCAGFPWCRLDNCGQNMSMDIQDMNGLLEAIRLSTDGATADEKKKGDDAIANLLKPENKSVLQVMGFRATGEGVQYDDCLAIYSQTVVDDF